MRDDKLDSLKFIGIIYIILEHSIGWNIEVKSDSVSYSLFGILVFMIPTFFFITGAVNYNSINKKGVINWYISRFKQMLIPLAVYIIFCLFLNSFFMKIDFNNIMNWLSFNNNRHASYLPYLNDALWYISAYFSVLLVYPLLSNCYISMKEHKKNTLLIPILLAIILFLFDIIYFMNDIIRYTIFYSIFAWFGIMYANKDKKFSLLTYKYTPLFLILSILCLGEYNIYLLNMQINKFPPNCMYFLYSTFWLCILINGSEFIKNIIFKYKTNDFTNDFYNIFSKESYIIYLWHPFIFLIIHTIIQNNITNEVFCVIIYFICSIIGSYFFTKAYISIAKKLKKYLKW